MLDALHGLPHQHAHLVQIRPLRLVDLEQVSIGGVHDYGSRPDAFAEKIRLAERFCKFVVRGRRDRLHDVARVELLIVTGILLVFPLLRDLKDLDDDPALLAESCDERIPRVALTVC